MAKKKEKTTSYRVITPFKSTINSLVLVCKKGDVVQLNSFEYSILSRFLEDIQYGTNN